MKTIIDIIRHGQTAWNMKKLIQGHIDNPLNEIGVEQAKYCGEELSKTDEYDLIIASPLSRARQTAEIINSFFSKPLEIITMNEVIERDFGAMEGEAVCDENYEKIFSETVVGLEKQKDLALRANRALLKIGQLYEGKKILIVSHSHFIKGALVSVDQTFDMTYVIKNLSLNRFEIENNKIYSIYYNKEL